MRKANLIYKGLMQSACLYSLFSIFLFMLLMLILLLNDIKFPTQAFDISGVSGYGWFMAPADFSIIEISSL